MIDSFRTIGEKVSSILGFPDSEVREITKLWNGMSTLYARAAFNAKRYREFFLGIQWDKDDVEKKDRVHRVYNYGAQITRKFQMYEGAKGFDINVKAGGDDPLSVIMAEATETLAYKILEAAEFFLTWMESRLAKILYGTIFFAPVWQPSNKKGSEKGTIEIRALLLERCRVLYQDNNYLVPEAYITAKRMQVDAARRIYGKLVTRDIGPDSQIRDVEYHRAVQDYVTTSDPSALFNSTMDDGMVTVWNYFDTEKYIVCVGDQTVINRPHKYKINGEGFCPIVPEHNIYLMGYIVGLSDLFFVEDQLKALNKLYSLLEEIIEDNAYPIMFEINNALRGTKLKRGDMRGKVIPLQVATGEEGVRTLQAPTIVQPVLAAIQEVKSAIFDVSSMPAAAFGAYQPNTKSGFQATIQMQPALQEIDGRHVRSSNSLKKLIQMCIAILEKEDPSSLSITLPAEVDPIDGSVILPEQKVQLENLSGHDMDIVFGNPLPKDDARVIQNETAKQINKYQSKRTTMQLLGVENPTKEMKAIEEEDIRLAKVQAEVQKILTEAQMAAQQKMAQAQSTTPGAGNDVAAGQPIQQGQNPAQNFPTPEGETEPALETAGEAVADTSTL